MSHKKHTHPAWKPSCKTYSMSEILVPVVWQYKLCCALSMVLTCNTLQINTLVNLRWIIF